MTADWYLIRTGSGNPSWNMALDETLLEFAAQIGRPLLRFYGWNQPAASFGYFQKYSEVASWTPLRPIVRRPTGGGLVPHDADWTYSLIFPPKDQWHSLRAEESYRRVHHWLSESLNALKLSTELSTAALRDMPGRCFTGAEKFDVLANGRKIAGAAQKRNKLGLLIQGSIQPGDQCLKRIDWERSFLQSASTREQVIWSELALPGSVLAHAAALDEQKYSTPAYNERR
jgi:lipoyl(octanoyl) transferase